MHRFGRFRALRLDLLSASLPCCCMLLPLPQYRTPTRSVALSQCSVSSSCTITVLFVVWHYHSALLCTISVLCVVVLHYHSALRRLALSQCIGSSSSSSSGTVTVPHCYYMLCYCMLLNFSGGALVILLTFHSFIIIIHQFHVFSIIFHVFSGFSLISMIFICTCIRSSQKFLSALGFAG